MIVLTIEKYLKINWCHLKIIDCQSDFKKQNFRRIFEKKKLLTNGICLNQRKLTIVKNVDKYSIRPIVLIFEKKREWSPLQSL